MARKKGDVYIDNQPFRVTSYQRGTTDDMVARFGSAEKGQTNLDSFKAATQRGWKGGMFQKKFLDDQMAGFISGLHHNPLDDKLYLTSKFTDVSYGGTMDWNGVTAWCYFGGYLYIAFRSVYQAGNPDINKIFKISLTDFTATNITLPTAMQNATGSINNMVVHGDKIFVMTSGIAAYRYDGATTFTSMTNGGHTFVPFRSKLYIIDNNSALSLITSEFGTPVFTGIKDVGADDTIARVPQGGEVYNGAIYIRKPDGLFRYDGIDVSTVINMEQNPDPRNFKYAAVFNGRYYYTMGKGKLYEFDGVNITLIQDMADGYEIIGLCAAPDRLLISTRYNKTSPGLYVSDNFEDPIYLESYTYGLFTYNGIGFFEYKHEFYQGDTGNKNAAMDYKINYRPMACGGYIFWNKPYLYYNASLEIRSSGTILSYFKIDDEFALANIGTSRSATIIGSEYDAGYPSVVKTLNGIMLECEGLGSNILVSVQVQTTLEGVVSDFTEVWRSDNVAADGAKYDYFLHDQVDGVAATDLLTTPLLYHKIVYKIEITVSGSLTEIPRFSSFTERYTLQPRTRRTWLLGLPIYGVDTAGLETPTYGNGTPETRTANKLRKVIYDAYQNKLPVLFYDLDFSKILDDSPLDIAGQNWLQDNDYIAIKQSDTDGAKWLNRRIQVTAEATDYTRVTLDDIGQRQSIGGATSGTTPVDAEVRKSYAVYVKSIRNERVIVDDNTVNDANGYSDFPSELVIELIEV